MSGNITGTLSPAPTPASTSAPAESKSSPAPTNQNVPPPGAVNATPKSERTAPKQPAESSTSTTDEQPHVSSRQQKGDSGASVPREETKPKLLEGKINGRTVRLPEEEWVRRAQLAESAQERFEKAAEKEKRADRILATAKSNPMQALMDPELGLTKEQIIAEVEKWYAKEVIEPEGLSEEQKRSRELETRLKRFEEQEAEAKQKQAQEAEQREVEGWREALQKQIIEAIEGKRLKKTNFAIALAAKYMRVASTRGYEAPMDLVVQQVQKETRDIVRGELQGLDYDGMVDLIGEEGIDVIRKAALQELRKRRQNGQFAPSAHSEPSQRSNSERVSYSDVNKRLKDIRMGR